MWKQNLEETKKRYINWWNHKGIIVNMWEHFQEGVQPHGPYAGEEPVHLTEALRNDYGTGAMGLPGAPVPKDNHERWFGADFRADYLDWYVGHSCLKADMLPVANTQLGPGSLAAILGSQFEGGDDTIWIHPDPQFKDKLTFDPNHPNYIIHKELLKACKRKANGNYYVGMPDLMEGLDVLAAMKGTDKVLLDTVMQPEVVEEQLQFINDTYFKVFDELYDIIREGDEMAFCYFSSWAPGKMAKLQSDISTMISVDDYRRFVQPFIRQQCQKIPYTLYHLDGVGAMHHLPALLEIEELKAIQWTPGVGEPQGGDPKWYDLYKQIIAAGKSIMACWVTLDQLRPLLDNVGGDGIHLEMDFHNEEEVEKALEIVKEYQSAAVEKKVDECLRIGENASVPEQKKDVRYRPLRIGDKQITAQTSTVGQPKNFPTVNKPTLSEYISNSLQSGNTNGAILLLDGGMGTMVQQYGLSGCSDEFAVSRPEIIQDIHRRYLAAGSDIIETDTFSSQRISLADYGWENRVREFNLAACQIARQMADAFTLTNPAKPRYVAGSVGPTNKCVSFSSGVNAPLNPDSLRAAYEEQIEALIEGGVDALLIETIFDMENAYICLEAARNVFGKTGVTLPVMLSFSQVNADGNNMNGQNIYAFLERVGKEFDIFSVGLNCTSEPKVIAPAVQELASRVPYLITAYGNAGMPNARGEYEQTPEEFARQCWQLIQTHSVNVIGGCCGTTDKHIAALRQLIEPMDGCFVAPHVPGSLVQNAAPAVVADIEEAKEEKPVESKPVAAADTKGEAPAADAHSLLDAIVAGKEKDAVAATEEAIKNGAKPAELINTQMIQAMSIVGQKFEEGTAFVPNLLMAGRAMKAALGYLKPIMEASGENVESAGCVVIGTVKGDLHDIGKNLVASMLEGSGFNVVNVGIDVDADAFVNAAVDNKADVICLSALLTTTMTYMKEVIDALESAGIRDKVKVMVGGAPVSQEFADEIGADGYSSNANEAVALAKRLMK